MILSFLKVLNQISMHQSPNAESVLVVLEQRNVLLFILLLILLPLPPPLAHFLDDPSQQSPLVDLGPSLHPHRGQIIIISIHYVVTQHSYVCVLGPLVLAVLAQDKGHVVHLEYRTFCWSVAWEIFIQQLQIANERKKFVHPRLQRLDLWYDWSLTDAFGLRGVHEWELQTLIPILILNFKIAMRYIFILTVPNLKLLPTPNFLQYLQILNFMLHSLAQTIPVIGLMLQTTVKDPIDDTGVIHLNSAFVSLGSVVQRSYHRFVQSVALGYVVVVSALE